MIRLKNRKGFTVAELLIISVLISIVFAAMATIYLTALKFFHSQMNAESVNPALALETIARKVNLANEVVTIDSGTQLNVRLDAPASLQPRDPVTIPTTDDTWAMYRIFNGSLRWKVTTDPNAKVLITDPELVTRLNFSNTSSFSIVNPSSSGAATVVRMTLIATQGVPPRNITLTTDALAKARSK